MDDKERKNLGLSIMRTNENEIEGEMKKKHLKAK